MNRPLFEEPTLLASLAFSLALSCLAFGDDAAPEYRTTNMRVSVRWVTPDKLEYRRQNGDGEWETVSLKATTGELSIKEPTESGSSNAEAGFRGGAVPRSGPSDDSIGIGFVNQTEQAVELSWVDSSGRKTRYHRIEPNQTVRQHTYTGHVWEAVGDDQTFYGSLVASRSDKPFEIQKSFDRPKEPRKRSVKESGHSRRSRPDSRKANWSFVVPEGQELVDVSTSPDQTIAAAWFRKRNTPPLTHLIKSSPKDGGRAELIAKPYRLPGDPMDEFQLVAIDTATGEQLDIDVPVVDFGYPRIRWAGSNKIIFEKVDRGHQRFRLFVVDPKAGSVRTPIDESTNTFIWSIHGPRCPTITYLNKTDEVIYASERSGFRHLYLVDLLNGKPTQAITEGEFLVRQIVHVNENQRYVDLVVGGYHDDQDPYHRHLIRASIDSGEHVPLTAGDGDHEFEFSPDRRYVVVNHSRIDSPPVHELRRTKDGSLVATLAKSQRIGDAPELPTRFTAKGRDSETDIWGLISFPAGYDANSKKQHPVIEYIYAGPHDSHVPKRYRHSAWHQQWSKLGFIVVQIDGMGTANRSKAFHDVCWQNLKDAGFPDRIAWMKAAAKEHPSFDLSRVGIYGTSAGGQNACGALLFHGGFYKAAMASCGCHDNRMDKSSWNEQWMGYPVGPHYSASSNIDNADRLQGDLLLLVGELDTNVPPESTLRLVDALIQADKQFQFLMIPNMGHSDGGDYGRKLTREFFVSKLKPNQDEAKTKLSTAPSTNRNKESVVPALPDLSGLQETRRWQLAADLYQVDRDRLNRKLPVRIARHRIAHLARFLNAWESSLPSADDKSSSKSKDIETLRQTIADDREKLNMDHSQSESLLRKYPFLQQIIDWTDFDNRGRSVDYSKLAERIESVRHLIEVDAETSQTDIDKAVSNDFSQNTYVSDLVTAYQSWFQFYSDYDPKFDWWLGEPSLELKKSLVNWARTIPADNQGSGLEDKTSIDDSSPKIFSDNSFLSSKYPPIDELVAGSRMPALMQRFLASRPIDASTNEQSETSWLMSWKKTLQQLRLEGKDFSEWCKDDQIDFHRLRQRVITRLAILDDESEPKISRSRGNDGLRGYAVGKDRLIGLLRGEFIDHTPDELIRLAELEYQDCRAKMVAASREMGFGDDWLAAVEQVKGQHVEPGMQPELIRSLAEESVDWIRERELLTIDPMAEFTWRMIMMTPKRQLVNPFFTGGEEISVSFPTSEMKLSDKRQSLRGNNPSFAKATVHHELIPGHHYQMYQTARFQSHRRPFRTPFWLEGWAVYWEFVLYEGGFPTTPEERLGFLVWRAHRYARIIFSLKFHMGRMSPDECVDFLVSNVGFDRRNATAEVRRSIGSSYPPLYQAAYMLGAMQLRQLSLRWIDEDRGTLREFHDAIIRLGPLPIALLEARLFGDPVQRDQPPMWEFKIGLFRRIGG